MRGMEQQPQIVIDMKLRISSTVVSVLVGIAWAGAVLSGFYRMRIYETTPGPVGRPPESWPATTLIRRVVGRPNLLMAVHPKCPCTRASLTTLAAILGQSTTVVSVRLLVFRSATAAGNAGEPPIFSAVELPGEVRVDDPGGVEAKRFGLATSGRTIVFDAAGLRQFAGGLNPARGRSEISDGGEAVPALFQGDEALRDVAEVFGCALCASTGQQSATREERR